MSTTPEPIDPKEKFKAALDKKNSQHSRSVNRDASEGNSKLSVAPGNKPKMFRRKSG